MNMFSDWFGGKKEEEDKAKEEEENKEESKEEETPAEEEEVVAEEKETGDDVEKPAVVKEAEEALEAWDKIYGTSKDKADDAYYYAEELWCEDKSAWASGKRKVLKGEWTVEQFENEMKVLQEKQKPVWDKLMENVQLIQDKVEGPRDQVVKTHIAVKKNLGLTSLRKLLGKKIVRPPGQREIRDQYRYKLRDQFEKADTEYKLLCGYPEGSITRTKAMKDFSFKETSYLIDHVHIVDYKRGLHHDKKKRGSAKEEKKTTEEAPPESAKEETPEAMSSQ